MKKYQFDLSHPYLLHRSKETPYFFFFAAFVSFAVGLTSRDISLFGIVLSLTLMVVGINKLKRKDKIMRIDVTILFSALTRMFPKPTFAP